VQQAQVNLCKANCCTGFWSKILIAMPFPSKVCVICSEEFELRPDKPGFANRCPACSEPEEMPTTGSAVEALANPEVNAARRSAMRDLLYRKDS
jgi:hypothetical protein